MKHMQMGMIGKKTRDLLPYLWIFGSYAVIDVWLRFMTRWINRYSIYSAAPNLFTVLWAVLLTVIVTAPRSKKIGRIIYGITYYVFLLYAVVQYGSYLVLGNFLWISDFLNAGEGADYASWVLGFISPSMILQVLLLIGVGIAGILMFPRYTHTHTQPRTRRRQSRSIAAPWRYHYCPDRGDTVRTFSIQR